jgi:dTDP-4-amino-4,6-dideoxygalactose transaminase
MNVPFYDIKAQYEELRPELDAVVHEVVSGGHYVMGMHHNAFETEMAERHQVKHAIAVNSGTDALRIALDAMGVGKGDEVITTAFTFVASVETIVQTGAKPVFVDIDPATFCVDTGEVHKAINPRTKAIVPVHLFGQLANVDELMRIACTYEIGILEDAAQAIDSTYHGKPAGNFGMAAALSFYVTKNLGAMGDGGLILTNYDDIAERTRSMRVHGMGRERYYYDYLGYTSRLDEIQAAGLRVKLRRLTEWNRRREVLAKIYQEVLKDSDVILPSISQGNNHTWHQFSVRVKNRDHVQEALKVNGVGSMIYYPVPIHFHEPYRAYGFGPGSLPETECAAKEILNLPIHPHLSQAQVEFAATTLREAARATVTA